LGERVAEEQQGRAAAGAGAGATGTIAGGAPGDPDLLAVAELIDRNAVVARGSRIVHPRICEAYIGAPLLYALPSPVVAPYQDLLLCFPFDLEPLPDGRGYQQAVLNVLVDGGAEALALHPESGARESDGTQVRAFGLNGDRLRWVFHAGSREQGRSRGSTLRPDGRWAQAVVRLPAHTTEVSGTLRVGATVVRPVHGGAFHRTEADTPEDIPFRLPVSEAWPAAAPPADASRPGAWALGTSPRHDEAPGQERLRLAVDLDRSGARDNADLVRLQRVLLRTLRGACDRAGIDWHSCERQASGDGYLLVLPATVSQAVPDLLTGLVEGLSAANSRTTQPPSHALPAVAGLDVHPTGEPPRRLRMRAALHRGPGAAEPFRLLDSAALHAALATDDTVTLAVACPDPPHGFAGVAGLRVLRDA
jgi:hypothetical protein